MNAPVANFSTRQRGFTLIEVMIAFVIISVGVLAILGMQVTGKQANYEAVQRTAASQLAQDIVERMRANPNGLARYCNTACGASGVLGTGLSVPNPDCNAAADGCTAANMAAVDLYQWEQLMLGFGEGTDTDADNIVNVPRGGLVNPRACISGPAGGISGMYTLLLVWRGSAESTPAPIAATVCANALNNSTLYGAGYVNRRQLQISFYIEV